MVLNRAQNLPREVLPETTGYVLNSFANFYFADDRSYVYRFNKLSKTWFQLDFYQNVVDIFT